VCLCNQSSSLWLMFDVLLLAAAGRLNSQHWGHGTIWGRKCASLHSNITKSDYWERGSSEIQGHGTSE
jgi:hypothetical protein